MLPDIHIVQAERERAAIGLYAAGNPLRFITRKAQLDRSINALCAANLWTTVTDQQVVMVGRVISVREHRDKNKRVMAFVQMEDSTAEFQVTIFAMTFKMYASIFVKDAILQVRGKVSHKPDHFKKKKVESVEGEEEVEEHTSASVKIELLLDTAEQWEEE